MAWCSKPEEGYPEQFSGKCNLCNQNEALAFWDGTGVTLRVCRTCATEKLPCLIADAVVPRPGRFHYGNAPFDLTNIWSKCQGRFWYAVAVAMHRKWEEMRKDLINHENRTANPQAD